MTWGTPWSGDEIRAMVRGRLKDPDAVVSADFDTGTITAKSRGETYRVSIETVAVAVCTEVPL